MEPISLFVEGEPYPQGSKTAILIGGKCRVIESKGKGTAKHKKWRKLVSDRASSHATERSLTALDGPCQVELVFYLPKPPSRPKNNWLVHVKPDIDKLSRSVLDSITGNLIVEDSRVSVLYARKEYAIDRPAGVQIKITPLDESGVTPLPL